jgi:hypothetical protein
MLVTVSFPPHISLPVLQMDVGAFTDPYAFYRAALLSYRITPMAVEQVMFRRGDGKSGVLPYESELVKKKGGCISKAPWWPLHPTTQHITFYLNHRASPVRTPSIAPLRSTVPPLLHHPIRSLQVRGED